MRTWILILSTVLLILAVLASLQYFEVLHPDPAPETTAMLTSESTTAPTTTESLTTTEPTTTTEPEPVIEESARR